MAANKKNDKPHPKNNQDGKVPSADKRTGRVTEAKSDKEKLTIVGVGASAGGFAAIKEFFAHIPEDTGLAFVVVMHLSPNHKSHLAELLQPFVRMPTRQISRTVQLKKNRVYVIPPNANLDTIDTHLRLSKLEERRQERAPIDHFFRALASNYETRAIGVVLSGTGSDGTLGLKEIKESGGLTAAQDPSEAEFDGMPQSAIATDLVDLVLPVAEIAAAIARFASVRPKLPQIRSDDEIEVDLRHLLHKVFANLKSRVNRDFSRYKQSTVIRRIQRRMRICGIEEVGAYLKQLRERPDEARILADDLLITVTSFFRDPEVYQLLATEVIPKIFDGKAGKDEIRVWSVGCASGEEAYSLAMLLLEEAARRESPPRIQVFGSDLHEHSLATARQGFYPGDIESVVSPERLKRFFVKEDGGYQVRKEVRELVLFAPQNLLSDPPFSRLDLVSCRNLLIYIKRDVQQDIIELFHYALRPNGYLLLGSSETIDTTEHFQLKDKKRCIYQKRNVQVPEPRLPVFPLIPHLPPLTRERPVQPASGKAVAYSTLHQRFLTRYAPPSVLISPADKVVHLSDGAGRYLVHPGGEPTMSIFKVVREEVRAELRSILSAIREGKLSTDSRPITLSFVSETVEVVLRARAMIDPDLSGFVLVIFDERPADATRELKPASKHQQAQEESDERTAKLEEELNLTRQRLQAIIEEYETSQEEMRASNEEMQSTNEELRSTMEELETSKEELQSMNEELQTVNQENRHKVEELGQLSSDLQNLLGATDIATLFLDRQFRIQRFTPPVSELFNIRATDRGRPISDLTHRLGYDALLNDAKRVLSKLVPIEREVSAESGRRCLLTRVMPYRSSEDRIEGIVITFVDITARKDAELAAQDARRYAEQIIDTLPDPLLVLTPKLEVSFANAAFYDYFQAEPEQTIGRKVTDLGNRQWNIPQLTRMLKDVLEQDAPFSDFQVRQDFEGLGRRVMLLGGKRMDNRDMILFRIVDRTEGYETEEKRAMLAAIVDSSDDAIVSKTLDSEILSWNGGAERIFGYTAAEAIGKSIKLIIPPDLQHEEESILERLKRGERIDHFETERVAKDGRRIAISLTISPIRDEKNRVVGAAKVARDVTKQKGAESRLRLLWESASELLTTHDPETMLKQVFGKIQRQLGLDAYFNYEVSEDGKSLSLASYVGIPKSEAEKIRRLEFGETVCGGVAMRRKPAVVSRIQESDDAETRRLRDVGIRAYVCNPMMRDDRLFGTLSFASRQKDEFAPEELDFLETISHYVTSAYERLQLVEQLRLSDRRKDEFLAILAHELRNPLAPIRTGLELLKTADDKLAIFDEVHGTMERQTGQLVSLVDDLLDVSRITRGKLRLKKSIVPLADIVRNAVEEAKPLIDDAGHTLATSIPSEPICLNADPRRLAQVISNLLNNAAKYTPDNGRIELAAQRDGNMLSLTVTDSGVGISEEKQKHVFDMFSQVDHPNENASPGLGIGLTLVKTMVDLHGGAVSVSSKGRNRGSSFSIRLPIETSPAPKKKKSTTPAHPKKEERRDTKQRVLIADDNEDSIKLLAMYIERLGHEVRVAHNGKQALKAAEAFQPDFALLDIGMPEMNGYEAARQMRRKAWGKSITLVALTGWGKKDDLRKSKEAGFDQHLIKPAKPADLKALLGKPVPAK